MSSIFKKKSLGIALIKLLSRSSSVREVKLARGTNAVDVRLFLLTDRVASVGDRP